MGINIHHKRQMNFELLRIFSMIIIIMHHYVGEGLIFSKAITINKILSEFLFIGGKLGVILFILITGYFFNISKFKIEKLIKLILEIFFYSSVIYFMLVITKNINFEFKDFIKSILPTCFNQYWFATSYVGLYLFSPFINKFISSINQEQHRLFIIVASFIFTIIPTFTTSEIIYSGFAFFIYIYMIAAYIKKYDLQVLKNNKQCILTIILTIIFIMSVSIFSTFASQKYSVFNKGITYFSKINSITILLLAISIFQIFKRMNVKDNKIISILSASSFSVYLIHNNLYLKNILWNQIFKIDKFIDANFFILIIHVLLTTVIIYIVSTIIDTIRMKIIEYPLFKLLLKKFSNIFSNINLKMNIVN